MLKLIIYGILILISFIGILQLALKMRSLIANLKILWYEDNELKDYQRNYNNTSGFTIRGWGWDSYKFMISDKVNYITRRAFDLMFRQGYSTSALLLLQTFIILFTHYYQSTVMLCLLAILAVIYVLRAVIIIRLETKFRVVAKFKITKRQQGWWYGSFKNADWLDLARWNYYLYLAFMFVISLILLGYTYYVHPIPAL